MFEINLLGIFGEDILADDVNNQLAKANGQDLAVNIASIGGYTSHGIAIYNALRNYKRKNPNAQLIANLTGYVASMASYVAMSPVFDMVVVEDNTPFMLHNSWTFAIGDKNALRREADQLDGIDTPMVDLTATKMKISKEESQALLDKETWFFGQEIVDAGLADEVISGDGLETDQTQGNAKIKEVKAKMESISFGKYAKQIAASLPIKQPQPKANIPKEDPKPKQENNEIMEKEEKEKIEKEATTAANARVTGIMALKTKYKETLKEKPEILAVVSDIIDKAIENPEATENEVLTDINLALHSGNLAAAIESPDATPQGATATASGEQVKKTEKTNNGW